MRPVKFSQSTNLFKAAQLPTFVLYGSYGRNQERGKASEKREETTLDRNSAIIYNEKQKCLFNVHIECGTAVNKIVGLFIDYEV